MKKLRPLINPWIILFMASLIKLWLVAGQHLEMISVPASIYDQGLFVTLADYIKHGQWLGPYSNLTLLRGPFYPIFLVINYYLKLPLMITEEILFIFACFVLLFFVRPLIPNKVVYKRENFLANFKDIVTVTLGLLLIFDPITTDITSGASVIREAIYPALVLLTSALFIGLVSYSQAKLWKYLLIPVAAGLSLSVFWLTREEGVIILPFSVSIVLLAAFLNFRSKGTLITWKIRVGALLVPFIILIASISMVSSINNHYYGINNTVELKTPQLLAAYSSLTRVKSNKWMPVIPVSSEQRQLIYKVSPAFLKLKPFLEGSLGKDWENPSKMSYPQYPNQIAGGWFIFALRGAVSDAGYYTSGRKTLSYYSTLANQVNSACENRKLNCVNSTGSLYPPLNYRYIHPFISNFYHAAIYLSEFRGYNPVPANLINPDSSISEISSLTHEKATNNYSHLRVSALVDIGKAYKVTFPVLTLIALLSYLYMMFFKSSYKNTLFILVGLVALTIIVVLSLMTFLTITSFPAINTLYLSSAYPLLILLDILSLVLLYGFINKKTAQRR